MKPISVTSPDFKNMEPIPDLFSFDHGNREPIVYYDNLPVETQSVVIICDDPDAPDADICFGVPKELFFVIVSGNLSNNLFNVYYSSYMAEITDKDSRLLQGLVKLTETDIYNLDFSKFIYVDGGIYRLQKLIDYAAGDNETTKAELLRVIYTIY